MKICHCIYNMQIGGAETMLVDILNGQVKTNDVHLIIVNVPTTHSLINQLDNKIKVHFLQRKPGSRSIIPIIKFNYTIWRSHFDIIHFHNSTLPKFLLLPHPNMFYTVHDVNISISRKAGMHIIAISKTVADDLKKRYKDIDVITIHNGINTTMIKRKQIYEFSNVLKIVQVARLDHEKKGQDILLLALAKLQKRGYIVNVSFIGAGPSHNYLEKIAKDNDLTENVNFLGSKSREWIYNHYQDFDLLVHPARYEGFGLIVPEALIAGLPVLVSDEGGPSEIIEKGRYGNMFSNDSPSSLANELEKIMLSSKDIIRKTKEAFEPIRDQYNINKMVNKYLSSYESVTNKRK